jgi:predicted Rossmann-fold nucleotide-binding protein
MAEALGKLLAQSGITIVYGGGGSGLMGRLADGALAEGGKVIGILPRFMEDLEWGHRGLADLRLVDTMRERKHLMITGSMVGRLSWSIRFHFLVRSSRC